MMRRIKLVLAMAAALMVMLVVTAGPAMADHTQRHENRLERWDRWEDHHDDFEVDEFEVDFDDDFSGFFWPGFLVFEVEDIDCDGFDDDFDGWIDEDAVCVVELELVEWWD